MSAIIDALLAPAREVAVANLQYPYTLDNPTLDLNDYATWEHILDSGGGSATSATGLRITTRDLLTFSPIMRVCRLISGDFACSPLRVVRKRSHIVPGDDMIDDEHPSDFFTSRVWHDGYSAEEGWRRFMWEALLYESAYIWIERDSRRSSDVRSRDWGRITGLYHINPFSVVPRTATKTGFVGDEKTGRLYVYEGDQYYDVELSSGSTVPLAWNEVFTFTYTPVMPLPMLQFLREQIGLAIAARGFQSKFFEKGGQAGGFLQVPAGMNPKAAQNLYQEIQKVTRPNDWFKMHVLYDGATFQKMTVDPRIADMTKVDENAARRVADAFEVNPGKMGLPGTSSYGAGESSRVDHVTSTMNHIFAPVAGQARVKLLSPRSQKAKGDEARDFAHDYSKLMEPDHSTRVDTCLKLRNAAVLNANDVLTALNLPTRKDPEAFLYYNPSSNSREQLLENLEDDETTDVTETEQEDPQREEDLEAAMRQITGSVHRACNNRCTSNQSLQNLIQHRLGETNPCFDRGIEEFATAYSVPDATVALASKIYFDGLSSFADAEFQRLCKSKPEARNRTRSERKNVIGSAVEQLIQQTLPAVSSLLLSQGTLLTTGGHDASVHKEDR